jgi:hypothetical protein
MSTFDEAVQDIKKAKSVLDDQPTSEMKHPDPKKHLYISLIKSGVRIAAGLAIAGAGWLEMNPYMQAGGILIVVAELLGIAEELV